MFCSVFVWSLLIWLSQQPGEVSATGNFSESHGEQRRMAQCEYILPAFPVRDCWAGGGGSGDWSIGAFSFSYKAAWFPECLSSHSAQRDVCPHFYFHTPVFTCFWDLSQLSSTTFRHWTSCNPEWVTYMLFLSLGLKQREKDNFS